MPNYGSVPGVYTLYPRIGSVTAITSSTVVAFLNHAEAKIHASISGRYSVPVVGLPPLLKYMSETLATAMMLRRFFSQELENKSAWVDGMFEEVKEMLGALEDGTFSLVNSDNTMTQILHDTQLWSSTAGVGYVPTFSLLDPIEQEIDPDRLQDTRDTLK